jgi:SAM-dependent methyltransferase
MLESRYTGSEHHELVPDWHTEESPWKAQNIEALMERNGLAPRTVCEVGCGFGEVLAQLQSRMQHPCELWGYDIAPHALEHARQRANERLHFELVDLTQEEPQQRPDGPFDLMLILDVVEHVVDYLGFLERIRTKSVHKIFQIPLDLSAQTVLRGNVLPRLSDDLGHIHYFTKTTALKALENSGYEVLDTMYTSSSNDLPTHVRSVKLMKAPRRLLARFDNDLAARALGGYRLLILAR